MNKLWLWMTFTALTVGVPLHAQSTLSDAEVEVEAMRMAEVLRPHVIHLDRDLVTFHYENHPDVNPTTIEEANKYIAERASAYFSVGVSSRNVVGPGFYVAIDPTSSREFGGDDYQLFVVTIQKGAQLLDTATQLSAREQLAFESIYHKTCQLYSSRAPDFKSLETFNFLFREAYGTGWRACQTVALRAFEVLKVQALIYGWKASNGLSGCRYRNQAINIIDPAAYDPEATVFLNRSKTLLNHPQQLRMLSSLYLEAASDFYEKFFGAAKAQWFGPLFNLASFEPADSQAYAKWKGEHIFRCGRGWPGERDDRPDLMSAIRQAYTDLEVEKILFENAGAFSSKVGRVTSLTSMRQPVFERLYFGLSGLPQDESHFINWKEAKDILIFAESRPEELSKVSNLLEEPESGIRNSVALLKQKTADTGPGALNRTLVKLGYGPRARQIVVAELISTRFGGVPPLSLETFADLDRRNGLNWRANRERYLKILRDCHRDYLDNNLTADQVEKGVCGKSQRNYL